MLWSRRAGKLGFGRGVAGAGRECVGSPRNPSWEKTLRPPEGWLLLRECLFKYKKAAKSPLPFVPRIFHFSSSVPDFTGKKHVSPEVLRALEGILGEELKVRGPLPCDQPPNPTWPQQMPGDTGLCGRGNPFLYLCVS